MRLTSFRGYNLNQYQKFDKWLIEHCDDFANCTTKETFEKYIEQKAKTYQNDYGVASNFDKAFKNSDEKYRSKLQDNLTIIENRKEDTNDLDSIIIFFKKMRNEYTHNGYRVNPISSSFFSYEIAVGLFSDDDVFKRKRIRVKPNFGLVETLIEMSILQCKRAFFPDLK
jgi:hypothetical protein